MDIVFWNCNRPITIIDQSEEKREEEKLLKKYIFLKFTVYEIGKIKCIKLNDKCLNIVVISAHKNFC